jgi:carbon monoxide dehydrogenase subunit G
MTLNFEFGVSAPADRVWALLTDLEQLLSLLPDVRISGCAAGEVFGTMRTPDGGEFRGTARVVDCDVTRRRVIIEIRSLMVPQPEQPAVLTSVQVEPAADRAVVAVVADLGSGACDARSSRVMAQFAANVNARLAGGIGETSGAGRPRCCEDGAATSSPDGIAGAVTKYVAGGVVRAFYMALGLLTGRPHVPRGPVRMYGGTPKEPDPS